jgi:hypothetical protein
MKILISLLIGAALAYGYLTTHGKRHITETVTQTNIVTQTIQKEHWTQVVVTDRVERVVWVTKTNIVTKEVAAPARLITTTPIVTRPTPPVPAQPAPAQYTTPKATTPTTSAISREVRHVVGRTADQQKRGVIGHTGRHRKME